MNKGKWEFDVLAVIAVIVAVFSTMKVLLVSDRRSFVKGMTSVFVGFPCGIIAGGYAYYETSLHIWASLAFAAFFSLIGENIVLFILNHGDKLGPYIDRAITNIIDKFTK